LKTNIYKFDAINFGSNTIMMCLIWSDHVNEWSAKNDGMINIFCNDKKCFKKNVFVEDYIYIYICFQNIVVHNQTSI
jgi:hypothetical protein